jgi:hypothetical protein
MLCDRENEIEYLRNNFLNYSIDYKTATHYFECHVWINGIRKKHKAAMAVNMLLSRVSVKCDGPLQAFCTHRIHLFSLKVILP